MFKVFAFLKKKKELSSEEFMNYYENHHVPLILSLTHTPLVYKRNYLKHGDPFNLASDKIGFDVVTEQIYSSREDLQAWLANLSKPEVGEKVRADEARFLDHSNYFAYVVDERVTSRSYPAE